MPKPNNNPVQMTGSDVKQHKRMAMGEKITGQTLPPAPKEKKTPA